MRGAGFAQQRRSRLTLRPSHVAAPSAKELARARDGVKDNPHPEPEREAVLSGSHLPRFSHVGGVSAGETGGSTDSTARVIVTRQGQDKTASRFGLGRLRLEHVPIGRAQGVNGLRSVQQILLQLGFMEPKV